MAPDCVRLKLGMAPVPDHVHLNLSMGLDCQVAMDNLEPLSVLGGHNLEPLPLLDELNVDPLLFSQQPVAQAFETFQLNFC